MVYIKSGFSWSQTPSISLERDITFTQCAGGTAPGLSVVSVFAADCSADDVAFFDDVLGVEVKQMLLERMVSVR